MCIACLMQGMCKIKHLFCQTHLSPVMCSSAQYAPIYHCRQCHPIASCSVVQPSVLKWTEMIESGIKWSVTQWTLPSCVPQQPCDNHRFTQPSFCFKRHTCQASWLRLVLLCCFIMVMKSSVSHTLIYLWCDSKTAHPSWMNGMKLYIRYRRCGF